MHQITHTTYKTSIIFRATPQGPWTPRGSAGGTGHISAALRPFWTCGVSFRPGWGHAGTGYAGVLLGVPGGSTATPFGRISAALGPFWTWGFSFRPGRGHAGTGYTRGLLGVPGGSAAPPFGRISAALGPFGLCGSRFDRAGVSEPLLGMGSTGGLPGVHRGSARGPRLYLGRLWSFWDKGRGEWPSTRVCRSVDSRLSVG